MPVVTYATNQAMYCQHGVDMTLYSAPHPMNGADYAQCSFMVRSLDKTAGTLTLTITAEMSTDGIGYFEVGIGDAETAPTSTPVELGGFARGAYLRFKYNLSLTGTSGDLGWAVFCLEANLIQSG
jgi:hypothetical protein